MTKYQISTNKQRDCAWLERIEIGICSICEVRKEISVPIRFLKFESIIGANKISNGDNSPSESCGNQYCVSCNTIKGFTIIEIETTNEQQAVEEFKAFVLARLI